MGQHELAEHGQQQGLGAAAGARAEAAVRHRIRCSTTGRPDDRVDLVDETDGPPPDGRPRRAHRAVVDGPQRRRRRDRRLRARWRRPAAARRPRHRLPRPGVRADGRRPADRFRVVALDFRGHGASTRPGQRRLRLGPHGARPARRRRPPRRRADRRLRALPRRRRLPARRAPAARHVRARCSCSSRSCSPTTWSSTAPTAWPARPAAAEATFPSRADALARYSSRPAAQPDAPRRAGDLRRATGSSTIPTGPSPWPARPTTRRARSSRRSRSARRRSPPSTRR